MNKVTTEEMISRIKKVHGDKYDCSKVQYVNSTTKITLVCPKHGEFQLYPGNISSGRGCQKCSRSGDINDFIKKAKDIHGDKYDYSQACYLGTHSKLKIICPKHGEFWQEARKHTDGHGCPKCATEISAQKQRLTLEQYINKANEVHSNKYDYSKVNYVNNQQKVIIICPEHGEFEQRAGAHLCGQGCPKCKKSSIGEQTVEKFLIKNKIKYIAQYEIPISKEINKTEKAYIDFYLPDYNLFIEYNGKQHYVPIEYFGGKIRFEVQKCRDNYIKDYCSKNNINLLEIRYNDNIENVLSNQFLNEYDLRGISS